MYSIYKFSNHIIFRISALGLYISYPEISEILIISFLWKKVCLVNYCDWLSAKITQEKELKLKMIENNKQIIKLVLNHKNITHQ